MAIIAIVVVLVSCVVLLSALRIGSDIDEHEQILHDFKNEKY